MTAKQLLDALQAQLGGYWEWLQSRDNALEKVRNLARQIAQEQWGTARSTKTFLDQVKDLKSFQTFKSQGETGVDDPPEEPGEEEVPEDDSEDDFGFDAEEPFQVDEDARDLLRDFLTENELPTSLMGFIETALQQDWSFARIVADLRETPEYKAAYPEMELRRQAGFNRMSEAEIRAYRGEARRLAREYFGADLTNADISGLLAKDKSLREYEVDLRTWKDVERWGPGIRPILAAELGYEPDDELMFRFMHAEIPTPELQRAYARGLMRFQPSTIGLGIRPEEEATLLEQLGIDPQAAFRGYQGILAEAPRAERLAMIERFVNENAAQFPSAGQLAGLPAEAGIAGFANAPFTELFRAIFYQDPEAQRMLQSRISREVARWQAGGGIAQAGSGAAVGLLTARERAQG